jgi:hypothetical protein
MKTARKPQSATVARPESSQSGLSCCSQPRYRQWEQQLTIKHTGKGGFEWGWVPPGDVVGLGGDTTEEPTRFVLAVVVPAEHEPDKVQRQQPADQLGELGDVAADEQAREDERE